MSWYPIIQSCALAGLRTARAVVAEAKARGLRASWIGPLERKLLYLRGKGAARQAAPGVAARVADGHRWIHEHRPR